MTSSRTNTALVGSRERVTGSGRIRSGCVHRRPSTIRPTKQSQVKPPGALIPSVDLRAVVQAHPRRAQGGSPRTRYRIRNRRGLPLHSCIGPKGHAALAQSAERLTRNEKVVGSIPTGGSTQTPRSEAHSLARGFCNSGVELVRCPCGAPKLLRSVPEVLVDQVPVQVHRHGRRGVPQDAERPSGQRRTPARPRQPCAGDRGCAVRRCDSSGGQRPLPLILSQKGSGS